MAFQPIPDGVEVVFHGVQNSTPVVNVYNVRDTGVLDTSRLTEIGNTFKDWWDDFVKPIQVDSYILQDITVTAQEVSTGPQVVLNFTTGNTGTNTNVDAAGNAAAVISWRTASIGRSYRGRTYIGALGAGALVNAQTLDSAALIALAAAGTGLLDALEAVGATLAVLSRFALGIQRLTGVLTDIIGIVVDSKVDSMRRRTAN